MTVEPANKARNNAYRASRTAGVIGGMGPMTTVDLMRRVVRNTPAGKEQEHVHILVDNRPAIPDRTAFLNGSGASPVPFLVQSAQTLQAAGADFLAIACNTAHSFWGAVQDAVHIPVLHMPRLLAAHLLDQFPEGGELILLATDGTLKSQIYQSFEGIQLRQPGNQDQKTRVMPAIYADRGVKCSHRAEWGRDLVLEVIESLRTIHTRGVILGCTDISLAFEGFRYDLPLIDPLDILARAIVSEANG